MGSREQQQLSNEVTTRTLNAANTSTQIKLLRRDTSTRATYDIPSIPKFDDPDKNHGADRGV